MLEPHEAAESFLELLARPADETAGGIYELLVEGDPEKIEISWQRVHLEPRVDKL
jgi:hypothetical protein